MTDCWTNALYPARPVILGRRLYPVSLGHCLVLWSAGSPYVGAAMRLPGIEDALLAIYLLSFPWGRVVPAVLCRWRLRLSCWWWGARHAGKLAGASLDLKAYLDESLAYPPEYEAEDGNGAGGKGHASGVPWPWCLLWLMMTRMPKAEALRMPVAEVIALTTCKAAENGAQFVSPQDRAAEDILEALDRKAAG